eukprot:COSAG05_NODE_885_length_6763_cov_10.115396_6_plen_60_part_00
MLMVVWQQTVRRHEPRQPPPVGLLLRPVSEPGGVRQLQVSTYHHILKMTQLTAIITIFR